MTFTLKNETFVVFGGTGFLGHYVIQHLAQLGARVRVVTRGHHDPRSLTTMGKAGQVAYIQGSLEDKLFVTTVLKGCQGVINLMGILFEKKVSFNTVHEVYPSHMAKESHELGIKKFIHVSALGACLESDSLYLKSKALGEKAVFKAFPAATCLRPSVIFGPEDDFFNRFAKLACLSPYVPVINKETLFQPVYVNDVASAIIKCLSLDTASGQTYELGGPEVLSFNDLMTTLLTEIKRKNKIIELPRWMTTLLCFISQVLPTPLLTFDQRRMLQKNNIVSQKTLTLQNLSISPTPLDAIIPFYLERYRPNF